MISLEFEIPIKNLNSVMDVIVNEDSKLQWVYYREDTRSVVVRTTVSKNALQVFLLKLASAIDTPTEITIVEERESEKTIHEAFLLRVDVSEVAYPVVILLFYNVSRFYPDTILVGTSVDAPPELVDTVLKLTIGKVNLLETEKVRTFMIDGGLFIQLRADIPDPMGRELALV